jgi:PucR family transcriptional regulator, purine catabolism regulatory protein
MANISVRDIVRLAMPPGSRAIAGESGLGHQVTRVASLRATPPAFSELRGGEVALVSIEAALLLDEQLTLARLIGRLARVPVACIAALGTITPADVAAAEEARMPLISVPPEGDLREVERDVLRLLNDYDAQVERRGAQLYTILTQKSLAGAGVPGLLELIAERTGQNVACYAPNGELRAQWSRGSARIALQALHPNGRGELALLGQTILVEPIGLESNPAGYLAIAGGELDSWDRLAATQGASALALELAKEQAVQAAEDRLRGGFFEAILAGRVNDLGALLKRGQELGYALDAPHSVVLIAIENAPTTLLSRISNQVLSDLNRSGVNAPIVQREGSLVVMVPAGEGGLRPRQLAEQLRTRLLADQQRPVVALSNPAAQLTEWSRALREAEQSLLLGRQLFGSERVLAFNDLGVYRLLLLLRDQPELWTFYQETLAGLAAYDAKQQSELLHTLDAYFNNLGNLRRTADAIHVHRNTLLYRLERIKEISGKENFLTNPDEYFALWLALKAHRVLKTLDEL